jgi:hypothetical protein
MGAQNGATTQFESHNAVTPSVLPTDRYAFHCCCCCGGGGGFTRWDIIYVYAAAKFKSKSRIQIQTQDKRFDASILVNP